MSRAQHICSMPSAAGDHLHLPSSPGYFGDCPCSRSNPSQCLNMGKRPLLSLVNRPFDICSTFADFGKFCSSSTVAVRWFCFGVVIPQKETLKQLQSFHLVGDALRFNFFLKELQQPNRFAGNHSCHLIYRNNVLCQQFWLHRARAGSMCAR